MGKKEKELRPIVADWLEKQGFYVIHEVMLYGYCDLVGCIWEERVSRRIPAMKRVVSVELKINDVADVLSQAKSNQGTVNLSYAAMPFERYRRMRPKTLQGFKDIGVGLLIVGNRAVVAIEAKETDTEYLPIVCRRLWNRKLRHNRNLQALSPDKGV